MPKLFNFYSFFCTVSGYILKWRERDDETFYEGFDIVERLRKWYIGIQALSEKLQNIKDRVWINHIPIDYIDSQYWIFLWAKDK